MAYKIFIILALSLGYSINAAADILTACVTGDGQIGLEGTWTGKMMYEGVERDVKVIVDRVVRQRTANGLTYYTLEGQMNERRLVSSDSTCHLSTIGQPDVTHVSFQTESHPNLSLFASGNQAITLNALDMNGSLDGTHVSITLSRRQPSSKGFRIKNVPPPPPPSP
jgi:hypothetical protein